MRYPEVNQTRFLAPGNHLNAVAQHLLHLTNELPAVTRLAQRTGRDDADSARRQAVDQLSEAPQTIEPALHGLFAEHVVFVQPGGQLHLLAQTLEDADLALLNARQHHMEAVGAQINRGYQ